MFAGKTLTGPVIRPHGPAKVHLMDFEREFMRTSGAEMAGAQMYEASYLHENNESVRRALAEIEERG